MLYIPDELEIQIQKDFAKTQGKNFVCLYLESWQYNIIPVGSAQQQQCFRNNPGLIYFLNNSKKIPMIIFNGDNQSAIMAEIPKQTPKAKAKPKGFGK